MQRYYNAYDAEHQNVAAQVLPVLDTLLQRRQGQSTASGFARMELLRRALRSLDSGGWQRSFHQKMFHEKFLCACSRVFWKTERPGQFARDHQTILTLNGWDNLAQEILISTPRR